MIDGFLNWVDSLAQGSEPRVDSEIVRALKQQREQRLLTADADAEVQRVKEQYGDRT